jgi:hypothetical protein
LRREEIRMAGLSTLDTLEFGLRLPVSLIGATAPRAGARSLPRIDDNAGNARVGALVFEKEAQLVKSPAAVFSAVCPANRCPITDARQILQSYSASGAFGYRNELFRDAMVDVGGPPPLFATALVEKASSAPSAQLLQPAAYPAGDFAEAA